MPVIIGRKEGVYAAAQVQPAVPLAQSETLRGWCNGPVEQIPTFGFLSPCQGQF